MSLLSRHITRSLIAPFGWGVVALTGMLLLNSLAGLIDKLGGKGLPWHLMVEAIALALPALMVLTLPMAVLTATLYAYGQLAADMELVAMYANGVSVWRMARPALVAAIGVAVVNFILFDQFVPRSNARYKALLNDVGQKHPTLSFQPKQLNLLTGTNYVLLADAIDSGDIVRVVTIYDLGGGGPPRVIHADSGAMAMAPNGTDMLMTLHHGEILEFPATQVGRAQRTDFTSDLFTLRDVTNQLNLRDDQINDRGDRELSGCELLDGIVDQKWYMADGKAQEELLTHRDLRHLAGLPATPPPSTQLKPKTVKHCGIYRQGEAWLERQLLSPAALAAKVADSIQAEQLEALRIKDLAAAAAREHQAVQPSDQPTTPPPVSGNALPQPQPQVQAQTQIPPQPLPPPPPLPQPTPQPIAPGGAVPTTTPPASRADSLPPGFVLPPVQHDLVSTWSDVLNARNEVKFAQLQVAAFEVEYHKKWAIPLSSFCFVLLGLALALRNPRGGIGLVIGGSLIIFMVFYILIIGGENLAKKLYINPVMAMEGPLIVFTLFGMISVAKANREMGSNRGRHLLDGIGNLIRRFRGAKPE